ncbi:MAG TPA: type ISP restriction/modification enzyme [Rhodanobacteraceae bacterium]|nr:type ISP restriction/modification enzyme [Rhodanobacteraceae bacterium]
MSSVLIQQYLAELARLRQVGGTHRESVVREAFKDLLKGWGRAHDLIFVPEYEIETPAKERRYVDGALLYGLRLPFGYWEAKDEKDDLDAEIELKFRRGYPHDNIIFDDSREAVLIQNKREVLRCAVDDVDRLQRLLELFFGYERPEIAEFRKAVEQFKTDLPAVCDALRGMIEKAYADNETFRAAADKFLKQARETINPALTAADVREILIQHILTEEIFALVFPGSNYHEDNNIARELYKLEHTFFTGNTKHQTLKALEPYYAAIRRSAGQISSHHEKQTFLKVVYENFYKVYNPKAADRLGVVYTPNEIVRFMIESTDWLCEKHFGRNLIDKDVEILDPAAGTGTFISELLEHFRGQPAKLKHKYLEELHANEVAILPYYVANLNIEATYAAISGEYLEYPNLCFVDTLDNVAGLRRYTGQQVADLFGMGEENVERIKRQNRRKISVVIGNPPYNANQANENDNNKNREYPDIDKRIKDTYIKASTAQKTKLYDMYARFFRWASDRIAENGVVAFVSNSSFIDARTFDGFRACLAQEFNEAWIIDLKGNARTSGERRRREAGNIFEDKIRVGIAVWFCVKKHGTHGLRIFYDAARDYAKSEEKRDFLTATALRDRRMTEIRPDAKHNWLNLTDNDFDTLLPVASKTAKAAKKPSQEKAIFKLFSLGVVTNRDEWVYDDSESALRAKVEFLIDSYNADVERLSRVKDPKQRAGMLNGAIKWTRAVKRDAANGLSYNYTDGEIVESYYRPFVKRELYFSRRLNEMVYQVPQLFGSEAGPNRAFCFSSEERSEFGAIAFDDVPNKDVFMPSAAQVLALYRYESGNRVDNITDWALKQFKAHYKTGPSSGPSGHLLPEREGKKAGRAKARPITRMDIFHYVYAVLHDPVYREKYAQNLKHEFPRIPFYPDFWRWVEWGKTLMDLHIGYEAIEPWPLKRTDIPDEKARKNGAAPKAMLKADKDLGRIVLDSETTLSGVPPEAWAYKLGNRSALEWILDQYKEKKPRDPTIREKFNTYRFADYKDKVIDLLMRVTRVSVETQTIVEAMRTAPR